MVPFSLAGHHKWYRYNRVYCRVKFLIVSSHRAKILISSNPQFPWRLNVGPSPTPCAACPKNIPGGPFLARHSRRSLTDRINQNQAALALSQKAHRVGFAVSPSSTNLRIAVASGEMGEAARIARDDWHKRKRRTEAPRPLSRSVAVGSVTSRCNAKPATPGVAHPSARR